LVNTPPNINVWHRALIFKQKIEKRTGKIVIEMIDRRSSRTRDFLRFLGFLIKNRADLIHIFEPFPPTLPLLYAFIKFSRVPVIYDSGDIHYAVSRLAGDPAIRQIILKFFESVAFRLSDVIAARGRGMVEILRYHFKLNNKKIIWIPDGVDLDKFYPPKNVDTLKVKLGLEGKTVICYASNYNRSINIGGFKMPRGWELIYVARKLVESSYKDFMVIMLGKGKELKTLIGMASNLGVKNYIKFTGFVPEDLYIQYLQSCDIGFYESVNDISYHAMTGTKMQEYLACGKPVVAGRIGEAKYVLRDAGLLVKPLNPSANDINRYVNDIADAITILIEDKNLRVKLGSNARRIAEQVYNWDKIVERLYNLYREVVTI